MKYSIQSFLFFLNLSIILSTSTNAQTYGQIFTKQEADAQFGSVLTSVSFSKQNIQNFLNQTNNYIMFRIDNNSAIILDDQRNPIHPPNATVTSSDQYTMYSTTVLEELLSLGNESVVYIEQRSNVLSVSNGGYTMEYGSLCPPICP